MTPNYNEKTESFRDDGKLSIQSTPCPEIFWVNVALSVVWDDTKTGPLHILSSQKRL